MLTTDLLQPQTKRIAKWINERLRIELTDGRIITGRFICTDNVPNLILAESEEFWKEREEKEAEGEDVLIKRNIGMVTIPGRHIVKIFHFKS